MTGLPRHETAATGLGRPTGAYCPRCDGPMYEPPSRWPTSIDDAFRTFGHPPPGFDRSLEDTMKELRMNTDTTIIPPPSFTASTTAQQKQHLNSTAGPRSSSLRNLAGLDSLGGGLGAPAEFRPSSSFGPPDPISGGGGGRNTMTNHQYSSSTSSVNSSGGSTGAGIGGGGPSTTRQHHVASSQQQPSSLLHHYQPAEMVAKDVKTVDNTVVIEGKHEQKDGQGQRVVSRNFNRSWTIPHDVDPNAITSRLNANGQLSVEAPRKPLQPPPIREHMIPVSHQLPRRMF